MPKYDGGSQSLEVVNSERDLGVVVDNGLNFREHVASIVSKANSILGIIRLTFRYLDRDTVLLLYKALVRPVLEYGQPAWSPIYRRESEAIESVQRRATKLVPGLCSLPYEQRLRELNLFSLSHRRLRGDMVFVYKYLNGLIISTHDLFIRSHGSVTRGHSYKLVKPRVNTSLRQKNFTQRSISYWNSLPEHVVNSPSLNCFKSRLDSFWKEKPGVFDFQQ
ncbi:hypothetical protein BSL78_07177 [Apostichopus japonicus]|uniref:RNA-directed DNA polymerase from mobile element jockey-like n=1 Tax=Stichopus japonicus TaxID=307972 RepID=A0A2G8L6L5_STIJA|nr:hypothetical protein BSL78_07177 [Apostichopus japonicus]